MNELIKINYDTDKPTVSARDLHEGLEIKSNFTTWFNRMCEYGFTESDYKTCFPNLESEKHGGQNMVDYQISVDMAKQICMIQRTDKGKQYREYFLDLEKAWNSPEAIMARALQMANKSIDSLKEQCKFLGGQLVEQQKLIAELQPKANYVDTILSSRSLVVTTQIAKDYGMTATTLHLQLSPSELILCCFIRQTRCLCLVSRKEYLIVMRSRAVKRMFTVEMG